MKEQDNKMQELQMLEQNLQNVMFQKQAFQIELNETQSALKEIECSGEEVYKIIGQLMLKTEKPKIKEELLNKEKILNLRINSLEKQEGSLTDQLKKLRKEVMNSIKK
ncbi:MAG: prefoldin subunit beta [Nanoarchaeota archaeon]|nr:prefoldin subunit beta [Nanoarchaeota archaeon]MBU1028346.1 prefoldin subunit beta [Nanoarchaeota archaeon]